MKNNSQTVTYHLEASSFGWEIAPGKTVQAWGYNNQLPGPTLKAKEGDTLVVFIKNNLHEPTTIHWHGLQVPSQMDGTEEVQRAILPGETFEYRFALPDAGTYWYHPHTNETVQMERGMYGAIIVEGGADPVVDAERVFMIDDMKLDAKNRFWKPSWFLPRWMERHDGREGSTLLLNGKETPEVRMAAGQAERWRFVNSSSARYFRP
jgi:FtsP/CotA-like multicopper oxidase with cupredoxin domain